MTILPALGSRLVEGVAAVMALEFLILSWRRRWRPRDMVTIGLALAPGLFLIGALRIQLAGAPFAAVGLCLALSLPFHLADLARRGLIGRKEKAGDL